jgi:Cd2+/Zn2+-exporting ATPase
VSRAIAQQEEFVTLEVSDFAALAGRGVQGRIGGQLLHLGNHRLVHELGQCSPELEAPASFREAGQDHHRVVPRGPAAAAGGGGRHGTPQQQGSGAELQALGVRSSC